jgi:hypothetical protein
VIFTFAAKVNLTQSLSPVTVDSTSLLIASGDRPILGISESEGKKVVDTLERSRKLWLVSWLTAGRRARPGLIKNCEICTRPVDDLLLQD